MNIYWRLSHKVKNISFFLFLSYSVVCENVRWLVQADWISIDWFLLSIQINVVLSVSLSLSTCPRVKSKRYRLTQYRREENVNEQMQRKVIKNKENYISVRLLLLLLEWFEIHLAKYSFTRIEQCQSTRAFFSLSLSLLDEKNQRTVAKKMKVIRWFILLKHRPLTMNDYN